MRIYRNTTQKNESKKKLNNKLYRQQHVSTFLICIKLYLDLEIKYFIHEFKNENTDTHTQNFNVYNRLYFFFSFYFSFFENDNNKKLICILSDNSY